MAPPAGGRPDLSAQVGDVTRDPHPRHHRPAAQISRHRHSGAAGMLGRVQPERGQHPGPRHHPRRDRHHLARFHGAVAQPDPGEPVAGDLQAPPPSRRPPGCRARRAARPPARSAARYRGKTRHRRSTAGTSAPGATDTARAQHADRWSRTSQPWQYGQCSTSRPHRSRQPGHVGQLIGQPGGDQQPPARGTVARRPARPRSRRRAPAADHRARRDLTAVAAHLAAARASSSRGRHPVPGEAVRARRGRRVARPRRRRSPAPIAAPAPASAPRSARRHRRRSRSRRTVFSLTGHRDHLHRHHAADVPKPQTLLPIQQISERAGGGHPPPGPAPPSPFPPLQLPNDPAVTSSRCARLAYAGGRGRCHDPEHDCKETRRPYFL